MSKSRAVLAPWVLPLSLRMRSERNGTGGSHISEFAQRRPSAVIIPVTQDLSTPHHLAAHGQKRPHSLTKLCWVRNHQKSPRPGGAHWNCGVGEGLLCLPPSDRCKPQGTFLHVSLPVYLIFSTTNGSRKDRGNEYGSPEMSTPLSEVTKLVNQDLIPCQSRLIISQVRRQIQKAGKVTDVSFGVLCLNSVLYQLWS